jgi:hypothetical protein
METIGAVIGVVLTVAAFIKWGQLRYRSGYQDGMIRYSIDMQEQRNHQAFVDWINGIRGLSGN